MPGLAENELNAFAEGSGADRCAAQLRPCKCKHLERRPARAQGNAELYLEKLHGLAEKEPNAFAEGEAPIAAWPKFRENLIGLTDVTRSHFEKLVQVRRRARMAGTVCAGRSVPHTLAGLAAVQSSDGMGGLQNLCRRRREVQNALCPGP